LVVCQRNILTAVHSMATTARLYQVPCCKVLHSPSQITSATLDMRLPTVQRSKLAGLPSSSAAKAIIARRACRNICPLRSTADGKSALNVTLCYGKPHRPQISSSWKRPRARSRLRRRSSAWTVPSPMTLCGSSFGLALRPPPLIQRKRER